DWATPFSLLCGFGVLAGYALLGATWLVLKTEGGRRARAAPSQAAARARAGVHGGREPVDAARLRAHRGALVLVAEYLVPVAGAAGHRPGRVRRLARARSRPRARAVRGRDRAVPARLSRSRDLELPLSGADRAHRVADRGAPGEPNFHAARDRGAAAAGLGLYRVRVLDLSRQSARRRGLSLIVVPGRANGANPEPMHTSS